MNSETAGHNSLLALFADVVAEFERVWPEGQEYPFPQHLLKSGPSVRWGRWSERLRRSIQPLNGLDTYRGLQPFIDYLARFTNEEVSAFSRLADINQKHHHVLLFDNPLTKVVGVISATFLFVLTASNARLFNVPSFVTTHVLSPLAGAGLIIVACYVLLFALLGPAVARARIFRDIVEIASRERMCQTIPSGVSLAAAAPTQATPTVVESPPPNEGPKLTGLAARAEA